MPLLDPIRMLNLVAYLRSGQDLDHIGAADLIEKLYAQVRAGNALSEAVSDAIVAGGVRSGEVLRLLALHEEYEAAKLA
jgi:hypothetical protein